MRLLFPSIKGRRVEVWKAGKYPYCTGTVIAYTEPYLVLRDVAFRHREAIDEKISVHFITKIEVKNETGGDF
jgi:hypothetical protein